ncbi:hypothetical protein MUU74_13650 [Chryseobacterium daecheongense]|uniref:hypothetical protein n=1 Tax=Chryseobacterium daecheongense TaxID=192389 RepID=UPI001FD65721|nr:hypothetical protein [Chryseobacterium daecheongense]UOU97534.1 hypothetical protein MUU74_13650 [Chryseobacterium daecheongense]
MKSPHLIPLIQGIYFLITGVWPLVHLKSFMEVTGPKTDIWLVQTVAVLILSFSILFFYVAFKKRIVPIYALMGATSTFGLAVIELYYYLQGTLKWVYFIDSAIEMVFFIYWLWYLLYYRRKKKYKANLIS